jgi:hypothetical protein
MRKIIMVLSLLTVAGLIFMDFANAGLINYDRLKKRGSGGGGGGYRRAAQPAQPAAAPAQPVAPRPSWTIQSPKVSNDVERKYDTNRDGVLQVAEVKIFLRDVLDVINAKGGYTINSDILKGYDRNKDGIISREEMSEIRNNVNN